MPNKKPTIPSIANFIFCLPVHSSGNIPPQAINKNSPLKKENNKDITFFSNSCQYFSIYKLRHFYYMIYCIIKKPSYKGKEVYMTTADLLWKLIQELIKNQTEEKNPKKQ